MKLCLWQTNFEAAINGLYYVSQIDGKFYSIDSDRITASFNKRKPFKSEVCCSHEMHQHIHNLGGQ